MVMTYLVSHGFNLQSHLLGQPGCLHEHIEIRLFICLMYTNNTSNLVFDYFQLLTHAPVMFAKTNRQWEMRVTENIKL